MKRKFLAGAIAASLALSGCVIAIDTNDRQSDRRSAQRHSQSADYNNTNATSNAKVFAYQRSQMQDG